MMKPRHSVPAATEGLSRGHTETESNVNEPIDILEDVFNAGDVVDALEGDLL
jgi:hypothetical protein